MSQFPMPGPGRGERRGRGEQITGAWDFMGSIQPMLQAMFNRYDRMGRIMERSAAVRPSMERHAFRQEQQRWDDENAAVREGRRARAGEGVRRRTAEGEAELDRKRILAEFYGIQPAAAQGVTAGAYGGESPHQSEAQLAGVGLEGGLTPSGVRIVYGPGGEAIPILPTTVGTGAPGAGAGAAMGDINISNAPSSVSAPAPGPAYNAMIGGGGAQYSPFDTGFDLDFESADIDTEREKRD